MLLTLVLLGGASSGVYAQWADEFNGTGAVSGTNWVFETGGGGYGNNELQCYTNSTNNSNQANGYLTITARYAPGSCDGRSYTSGRIKTQGRRTAGPYGRLEGRLRGPMGQGLWPAFWTLGNSIGTGTAWPGCGEIDLMEHINNNGNVLGTLHWSNSSGAYQSQGNMNVTLTFTAFHTYAIEWTSSYIRHIVDGVARGDFNIAGSTNGTSEFHAGHFVLLNLAVGGNWPGSPNGTTPFPSNYDIDYVRYTPSGSNPTPTPTNPPTATPTAPSRSTPTATPTSSGTRKLIPGQTVWLRALANNRYVTADNAGASPLIANRTAVSTWERFTIVDAGSGMIALRANANNRYVTAENGGASALIARATAIGGWERFTEVAAGANIALRANANGRYVCADNAGASPLIANRTSVSTWETFAVGQ